MPRRVRVYRNLSKDCWSIQQKTPKGWRVFEHIKTGFALNNCKFIIHGSGQSRVRRENKKYVHAFIEGDMSIIYQWETLNERIRYNPYRDDYFNTINIPALHYRDRVVVSGSGNVYTARL
jgi:hypothetical protein